MKKWSVIIAVLIVGVILLGLFIAPKVRQNMSGSTDEIPPAPEVETGPRMLLDYYERTVGTPMEMPFYELVIYEHNQDHLLLEEYTEGGMDREYVRGYEISTEAYPAVLSIIEQYDMPTWNEQDFPGITGALYVCRFFRNEQYTRVSSEQMPENGRTAFSEVKQAMAAYKAEGSLIYERYVNGEPQDSEPAESDPNEPVPIVQDEAELRSYLRTTPLAEESDALSYFDIPEQLLQEDENGTFFYYTSRGIRYYLDGSVGHAMEDGIHVDQEDSWILDFIGE